MQRLRFSGSSCRSVQTLLTRGRMSGSSEMTDRCAMSELEGYGLEPGQQRGDVSEDCDFNQTTQNWGENPHTTCGAWVHDAQGALATLISCAEPALRD